MPFQLQVVIDDAIAHSDTNLLLVVALGFGGLVLLQGAISYLRNKVVLILSSLLGYQIVGNLVRHLTGEEFPPERMAPTIILALARIVVL